MTFLAQNMTGFLLKTVENAEPGTVAVVPQLKRLSQVSVDEDPDKGTKKQ